MFIPPRRIVLSGGGIRAIGHFGALNALEKRGLLKSVREYVGVSAGALVGFTLMLGYTLQELTATTTLFDFGLIRNIDPEAVLAFPTTFGLDNGEQLIKFIHSLLRIKNQSVTLTFAEWDKQKPNNIKLRCYATDLTCAKLKEFSLEKTPNTPIVDALRASMCLPAYFTPVIDKDTGHLLIDGGVLHNFPLAYITPDEKNDTFGICFEQEDSKVEKISDLITFFSQIYLCQYITRNKQVIEKNKENCIVIPPGDIAAWNFELSREDREKIIKLGEDAANKFCDSYFGIIKERRAPVRRYSVG